MDFAGHRVEKFYINHIGEFGFMDDDPDGKMQNKISAVISLRSPKPFA
jgi:hypothetical protein